MLHAGNLRCFGAGGDGAFGIDGASLHWDCGDDRCNAEPLTYPLAPVVDAAVGDAFVCVAAQGRVHCTGTNTYGELGRGTRDPDPHIVPAPVDVVTGAREIAAGRNHACALLDDGRVACWGVASHGATARDPSMLPSCGTTDATSAGRLGLPLGATVACSPVPTFVPGIDDAVHLVAGPFATCIERASVGFVCFGLNVEGSLGIGTTPTTTVWTPTPLARAATDVALGATHGALVHPDGNVYAFGSHGRGELGLGAGAPDLCAAGACARAPTRVPDLVGVVHVVAGDEHTCALMETGTVSCMGSDLEGQLGDSSGPTEDCAGTPCARTPRAVYQTEPMVRMAAAGHHTLLVSADGEVLVFGSNAYREAGTNASGAIDFPVPVYGVVR